MNIPVVRAQHLIHYIGVLRDAGAPVERELARSRLPAFIEQTPDAYVSLPRALDWAWRSSREVGVMEVGFLSVGFAEWKAIVGIIDIASAAGNDNAPHFSRAFKRLTGMTPRDYRCDPA